MPKLKPPAIDNEQFALLASYGLSNAEIAAMARISVRTLQRNYAEFVDRGRLQLVMSLRRKQTQVALDGNVAMLIWLGKQYLGQAEKLTSENTLTHEATIVVDIDAPATEERDMRRRETAAAVFAVASESEYIEPATDTEELEELQELET